MLQNIVEAEVNVGGVRMLVVPNTLVYKDGSGTQVVRVLSAGNGAVTPTFSNNVEDNKGYVSFSTNATLDLINAVKGFKRSGGGMLVTLSMKNDDGRLFTETFPKMALVNHPENQLQSEGVIALEFEGAPSI